MPVVFEATGLPGVFCTDASAMANWTFAANCGVPTLGRIRAAAAFPQGSKIRKG
jgi:hypothetical protein